MLVKADGIHLGQDDLPVEKVRELVGSEMIIGLSTHSPEQAQDAVRRGADYIGVGPIYRTYTKKDVCEPVGLEYLDYVVKSINIPFVAIGGIKESNMDEVISRGAKCVAMVTEIVGAENIEQKILNIRHKLGESV
jgi:thiamine-phosphate pyrophosphorylase